MTFSDALYWLETNIPAWVYITVVVHLAVLGTVAYLILLERKVASWVQDRIGPNRVGLGFGILPVLKDLKMFGLGQPLADGLKFIVKEDYRAKNVDKILFTLAPAIMIFVVILSIAVIPWGGIKQSTHTVDIGTASAASMTETSPQVLAGVPNGAKVVAGSVHPISANGELLATDQLRDFGGSTNLVSVTYRYPFQIANLNVGVLFVLAFLSLAVYGVVIGGWASNNKYSFLGGLRATANMISYEVPLGLAVLCIVLMYGTLDMGVMVDKQAGYWFGFIPAWNVFTQPVAFLMFLVCIHAEANRAPFDTAEAEQELVGGYHTEYSSMRFALFFLAEYAGMITTSCVCVALFFGGWHVPWLEWIPFFAHARADASSPAVTTSIIACVIRSIVFFSKAIVVLFIFMWTRWSLPRFRFDQIMQLAWRALIPMSLALVVGNVLAVYFTGGRTFDGVKEPWVAGVLLLTNIAVLVLCMIASTIIPAAPDTNRKLKVVGSRYATTPLPAGVGGAVGSA